MVLQSKYYCFLLLLFCALTKAQNIVFADNNLKTALLQALPSNNVAGTGAVLGNPWVAFYPANYVKIDTNNDGEIQQSEALAITYLQIANYSITNFGGIENFINLKFLLTNNNPIVSINLSALNQLEVLIITRAQLTSLNLTGLTSLKYFNCLMNQLTTLDFSGLPNLKQVACINNLLGSLDFTGNPLLEKLNCSYNPNLTSLKIKNGTIQQFPDATFCVFDGNPNLHYICADAAEIPVLQNFQTTSCTVNNTCVIDSACALAIEDFEAEKISVFPNPATSSFVVTTAVSKVVVYTLTGQVVKQFEGSFEANYSFDIQGLSVGVYIVKIIKEDGNEKIVKLVKQ